MMNNILDLINELSKELDVEFKKICEEVKTHCSLFLFEKYRKRLREYKSSKGIPDRQIHLKDTANFQNSRLKISEFPVRQGVFLRKTRLALLPLIRGKTFLGALAFKAEFKVGTLPDTKRLSFLIELLIRLSEGYEAARQLEISKGLTDICERSQEEEELFEKGLSTAIELLRVNLLAIYRNRGSSFKLLKAVNKDGYFCVEHFDRQIAEKLLEKELFLSSHEPELATALFGESEAKSFIATPLYSSEGLEGIFIAADRKENPLEFRIHKHLDENDLELLHDLSHRLAVSLSRIRLKERLEGELERLKELQRENQEYIELQRLQLRRLNALHKISQAMRATFSRTRIIKTLLLGIVIEEGLNFSRALFLERDKDSLFLKPLYSLSDECAKNFRGFTTGYNDLHQFLMEVSSKELDCLKRLDDVKGISYSGNKLLERVVLRKKTIHVTPGVLDIRREELYQLKSLIGGKEFVIVPVSGQQGVEGVLVVEKDSSQDKSFSTTFEILELLADSAGLSLELAKNYNDLLQITKSLEDEKELSNYYKTFLENILQSLETAIVVLDRELNITEVNRSAEHLLKIPKDALVNHNIKSLQEIFFPFFPLIEEVAMSGETLFLTGRRLPFLGDVILDIRILPLFEQAKITGVILSINDVTERYRLEEELKIKEKLSTLGEVSAKIAHEIRNPISVISGFVNRLKKDPTEEKVKKYSDIILEEMKRLEKIVSEVLEYSRSSPESKFKTIFAYSLCKEVVDEYRTYALEKGIDLTLEGDKKASFFGNKNRIKQVIINLVQNAIEASKKSEAVRIVIRKEDNNILIEVINKGKVIPSAILKRVFEPFFTTKSYGTGLGLFICKSIVEEHKGHIEAESNFDKGTIFRVILPSGGE
ncbi:hypothetical protein AT15_03495 [Kosmotoga arenicorallina S304]|uniref:histidine kinase n=1 Tax=Kosmotoga arenicorallina S304 TaxID=1453497 RepID=A0A176K4B0_9BACT|nr:sensor histidine kinase [Kosmotoga arenicorallina]OAA31901.1 hypothetical protein AT15_03495 [Kosmotoga arenicorallina S304]